MTHTRRQLLCAAAGLVLASQVSFFGAGAATAPVLVLGPLTPGPVPVGTTVLWTAAVSGANAALFQFRVAAPGGSSRMVRDFGPNGTFEFTPLDEGEYQISVEADANGARLQSARAFIVTSRITAGVPVVSPTAHPLVALYSAPPCGSGEALRVSFRIATSTIRQYTPWKPCRPGRSVNLYVGGLAALTPYMLQQEVFSGSGIVPGAPLSFTAGAAPSDVPGFVVTNQAGPDTSGAEPFVLYAMQYNSIQPSYPFAADLVGRTVWYYDKVKYPWQHGAYLLRPLPGGTMLMVMNDTGVWRVLREIDIAGNTLRETSASAISAQLEALGEDPVTAFHHDAIRLPNGHTLVLGAVERLLTDVQGPGEIDVLGDMLIDLDPDWRVSWAWNSFDHLDPRRAALLGETCAGPSEGCPPVVRAPRANDWTHTNSINHLPDGNLLLSVRNQDWLLKIDYRNGVGTGAILWRLGPDGDFRLETGGPDAWFTHQHDATFTAGRIVLYDNGNTRCTIAPVGCNSRGQAWVLDEAARTARLELNADLGSYSEALGSAGRLSNGNYHFGSGLARPVLHSEALEVTADGRRAFLALSRSAYRSFRMRSLYAP